MYLYKRLNMYVSVRFHTSGIKGQQPGLREGKSLYHFHRTIPIARLRGGKRWLVVGKERFYWILGNSN